jgi:hypothetical protein
MKFILAILLFLMFSFKIGDDSEKLKLFTFLDNYDWKDCVSPSKNYIEKETSKLRKHFNEYIANIDSFENYIHFIDLNGDKNLDAIYSGGTGAAGEYVVFLLNTGNDYRILFEEYTNISELVFENKKLVGYTGLDFGCCADYVYKETKYQITNDWKKIAIYQRARTSYTELPKTMFEKPIKFMVKNDIYKLRSSPIIDDKSVFIYDTVGNVISSYNKGSIGYAWSEAKDSSGRSWWFVEMEPNTSQIGSRLNSNQDSLPVRNLGWFISRYLEQIK